MSDNYMKNHDLLQTFVDANLPPEDAMFRRGSFDQRDIFLHLAGMLEEETGSLCKASIIGEHRSKSITLPVVEYSLPDGASLVIRNNFYDYKISVVSPQVGVPDAILSGLTDQNKKISPVYCEGFPEDKVYGSPAENRNRFTIELANNPYVLGYFILSFAKLLKAQAMAPAMSAEPA
jgi:hypothetical protein